MLVVIGATGWFGSAAVLLGLAMGASRVVAAGRNGAALEAVAAAGGERVTTVVLTGDLANDVPALREAAGGGANMVFDMIGEATDHNATLAGLRALRRGGRLVLMGTMMVPLPLDYIELMANDLEIIGNFMYRRDAFRKLVSLVRGGLLDLSKLPLTIYKMTEAPAALAEAARLRGLNTVVMKTERG